MTPQQSPRPDLPPHTPPERGAVRGSAARAPLPPEQQTISQWKDPRPEPFDEAAEQGLLGAMLLSKDVIPDIITVVRAEDFFRPGHQIIYRTIVDMFTEGLNPDVVLVATHLDRQKNLTRVGGQAYLLALLESVPTAANAAHYAHIISEKAVYRHLIAAGTRVVQLGFDGAETGDVDVVVDRAQQEIFAVTQRNITEDYAALETILTPILNEISARTAGKLDEQIVFTGFADLDEKTNGFKGGQMIIVAARPGIGKSTLALDFIRHCAIKEKKACVLFSLEMSRSEIVMRLLSAEASVKFTDLSSGNVKPPDWTKLAQRAGEIEHSPIFIDDSPHLTMMEIRAKARRLKDQHDIRLLVVDYLQLMTSGKRVESRQQEVSEFSRQFKLLAKELNIPVIAISQLNRGPEARQDKKPQVADLRESGSLEQDADMVILIHRPDSQTNEREGEADLIVAKNRGGPTGTVPVVNQLHFSRFADMYRGATPPGIEAASRASAPALTAKTTPGHRPPPPAAGGFA